MIGYIYDSYDFYVGETNVFESPLEPGVFPLPPNTTLVKPPEQTINRIAKWDGSKWVTVPNYSGKDYYKKSDKSLKKYEIGEEFSSDYTDKKPPTPDYVYIVWSEKDNNWITDIKLKSDYDKNLCKQIAKGRIAQYDWIMDDTTTPKLLNKQDFFTYRSKLRLLILNPVENPTWPEVPQEVWGNE